MQESVMKNKAMKWDKWDTLPVVADETSFGALILELAGCVIKGFLPDLVLLLQLKGVMVKNLTNLKLLLVASIFVQMAKPSFRLH